MVQNKLSYSLQNKMVFNHISKKENKEIRSWLQNRVTIKDNISIALKQIDYFAAVFNKDSETKHGSKEQN